MPYMAIFGQPGFQAHGRPRLCHRRASRRPPGALGSPFVLLLACLAAAHGPDCLGLLRCGQGGLACTVAIVSDGRRPGGPDSRRSLVWMTGISGPQQTLAFPSLRLPLARPKSAFCRKLALLDAAN